MEVPEAGREGHAPDPSVQLVTVNVSEELLLTVSVPLSVAPETVMVSEVSPIGLLAVSEDMVASAVCGRTPGQAATAISSASAATGNETLKDGRKDISNLPQFGIDR
jgi:hypothetical protein